MAGSEMDAVIERHEEVSSVVWCTRAPVRSSLAGSTRVPDGVLVLRCACRESQDVLASVLAHGYVEDGV